MKGCLLSSPTAEEEDSTESKREESTPRGMVKASGSLCRAMLFVFFPYFPRRPDVSCSSPQPRPFMHIPRVG